VSADREVRILLVDDDEDERVILESILADAGPGRRFALERAGTAGEALALVATLRWDLLLLDYRLGETDGLALLRECRARGVETPVIFLTGQGDQEIAVEAMKAGATDFLVKSKISLDGLLAAIRHALDLDEKERARREAERRLGESVSERARLEADLRQAQKMEAIGRVAGGIAHDFNNLLTVITGYSGLVLESLKPDDPLRPDILEIRAAGLRAASLVSQLLAFGRRQALAPKAVDLDAVLADTEKLLRRVIDEDVTVLVRRGCAPAHVRADPGQLAQAIMHLAVNARDRMPRGGLLRIETASVDLDDAARGRGALAPGAYVTLAVSDTGPALAEEERGRVFEPFWKPPGRAEGGLGLAMAHGFAKHAGGHLEVASEEGGGTTFRLYLPRAEEASESAPRAAAPDPASAPPDKETVLLVEDEAGVRKLVRELLRRSGYAVLDAATGADALALAARHAGPISVLLTDVIMPGMSGRELVERLLARRPEMRAVVMSGYTEDEVVCEGQAAFLAKPFTAEALLGAVRAALASPKGP
jgi:signal transduction histidine kinase